MRLPQRFPSDRFRFIASIYAYEQRLLSRPMVGIFEYLRNVIYWNLIYDLGRSLRDGILRILVVIHAVFDSNFLTSILKILTKTYESVINFTSNIQKGVVKWCKQEHERDYFSNLVGSMYSAIKRKMIRWGRRLKDLILEYWEDLMDYLFGEGGLLISTE